MAMAICYVNHAYAPRFFQAAAVTQINCTMSSCANAKSLGRQRCQTSTSETHLMLDAWLIVVLCCLCSGRAGAVAGHDGGREPL